MKNKLSGFKKPTANHAEHCTQRQCSEIVIMSKKMNLVKNVSSSLHFDILQKSIYSSAPFVVIELFLMR